MRKLISVLVAVVMLSAFAVSASATDYGTPPVYELPPTATSVTATDILAAIADSGGAPVVIDIGDGDVQLSLTAISAIINADEPVTFVADGFSITIDPADITDAAKAVNLSMDVAPVLKSIGGVTVTGIAITPATAGQWGFAVTVSVPAGEIAALGLNASKLKAYYVDSNGNALEEIGVTVNSDGSVSIKISGASSYVITDQVLTVVGSNAVQTNNTANDPNPSTGVAVAFIGIVGAGVATVVTKKRKK